MKAKPGPGLALEEVPEPAIGINDVLIRVRKTGICGTDLHIYDWDDWARRTIPVPMVVGHEFVGEVVAVGANVSDFRPGDLVSGEGHVVCGRCRNCMAGRRHLCAHSIGLGVQRPGAFAELVALPMTNIWHHWPGVEEDVAAIFDPFGNAVHTALAFPVLGEDVLVTGAGPIGCMATAVVRHAGARHVVVSDPNPYRLELARRMGATLAVDPRERDLPDVQRELGMTEGFDIGLEMSGSPDALHAMIANMAHGGRIALLGIPPGEVSLDLGAVIFNMLTIKGIYGREMYETWYQMTEERLSEFLRTDATILFSSCFDANGGLFEALLSEEDAVISDQLNHASIIDGIRLCKARRLRYANGDLDELEACLREAAGARFRLIATDGVFSMDGYLARLDGICELAERYDALVMVDDSHGVGVVGPDGRGTHEHFGVLERVDILTGTLGKAIGGASGGYVSGRREIVELLRQRARPYLFSNSVAPPVVAASLRALELVESSRELRDRLRENTARFRSRLGELRFDVLPGEHPIVPVMIGDEAKAARFSQKLVELGVYAVSFSYPVVPRGTARIRTQMSAAHSREDVELAAERFRQAREQLAG